MPKLQKPNLLIESWIELNELRGEMTHFKTLRHEADGVNFFAKRMDGARYKNFGIHSEADGFHVTHLKTGGLCGEPFSSEKSARRFIFCIIGLTKWHKVVWSDHQPYLKDQKLLNAVKEAHEYCEGVSVPECPNLLELIRPYLSENEVEELEPEPVEFGSGSKPRSRPKTVRTPISSEKSGWGNRVTN